MRQSGAAECVGRPLVTRRRAVSRSEVAHETCFVRPSFRCRRVLAAVPGAALGLPCHGECDLLHLWFHRLESVTFPRPLSPSRRSSAILSGILESIMIGLIRAVALCATLAFGLAAAHAADKAFKRDD